MRWLVDECIGAGVVAHLRKTEHDVVYVAEVARRTTDREIVNWAQQENRLVLTEDKDFGELVVRWNWRVPGVVLMRISPEKRSERWPRLEAAIARFGDALFGRFTVVEENRFRTRPLGR